MSNIMYKIYGETLNKKLINNEESQKIIEEIVFDQYGLLYTSKKGYSVGNIDTEILSGKLKQYIINKEDELGLRVKDLKEHYENNYNKSKKVDVIVSSVINKLRTDYLLNLCLLHFLIISSNLNTDDKDKTYSINVAINIGRKMVHNYLYSMKCSDITYKDVSYSS